jgi:hypothetical protein
VSVEGWDRFVESRVVRCCRKCNAIKEDLTLQEFKLRSGIEEFFAERLLGQRIEVLDDIGAVTDHIIRNRTIAGRSVRFDGKLRPRALPATASA